MKRTKATASKSSLKKHHPKIKKYSSSIKRFAALVILIAIIAFIIFIGNSPFLYKKGWQEHTVTQVIDGDTIIIDTGEQVRYIGVDTPEIGQPGASEATQRNKDLLALAGNKIKLERDILYRDPYDRILAYVWVDNVMINESLLAEGFARTLFIPPDNLYQLRLTKAFESAKRNKLGLWKTIQ